MTKNAILEIFVWCCGGAVAGFAVVLIIDIIRYLMGQ